jgi:P2-related tail formation protein
MDSLIPLSIKDERTPGFEACITRMGSLDITPLLIYLVDQVNATALPHLAEQFNIYGRSSWRLAVTDLDKRNLIKKAIELHRRAGTPWAIKQAILALGFSEVDLIERDPVWNEFKLLVRGRPITQTDADLIKEMVKEFAPARSRLFTLGYGRLEYWADDGYWGDDQYWGGYEPYKLY